MQSAAAAAAVESLLARVVAVPPNNHAQPPPLPGRSHAEMPLENGGVHGEAAGAQNLQLPSNSAAWRGEQQAPSYKMFLIPDAQPASGNEPRPAWLHSLILVAAANS